MAKTRKPETLRRLRLGDLRRYCHDRYGAKLPDDDAGRSDLFELLLPISLTPAESKWLMAKEIERQAPWMPYDEAEVLIDRICDLPERARMPSGKVLGARLNLTNAERERLRLWTIWPAGMTDAEMVEYRRAKKRARDERRRQRAGAKPRDVWLAASLTKQKPWQAEGISRRTWFRRRQKPVAQVRARQDLLTTRRAPVPNRHAQKKERAKKAVGGLMH
jgi:hypothetical protein